MIFTANYGARVAMMKQRSEMVSIFVTDLSQGLRYKGVVLGKQNLFLSVEVSAICVVVTSLGREAGWHSAGE